MKGVIIFVGLAFCLLCILLLLCFNKVSLYCLQKKLVVLWLYLWTDDNKLLAIILIDLPTPTPFGVDLPLSAKSTPFFLPLSVNYLYEMLCCDLENMMNYKSGSWNFLHLFFYHCLFKKLPFSIWFKLSWKVPGCPRFAPFHFKFWKFSGGGGNPPKPPLWRLNLAALGFRNKSTSFFVRIYPFWTKNLPPSNFGVGRSVINGWLLIVCWSMKLQLSILIL